MGRPGVEDQGRASLVGRRKLSNVELSDDEKPSDSHVALNTIVGPDGSNARIPAGQHGLWDGPDDVEFGTFFIGYSSTPSVTELMLRQMFVGDPPGNLRPHPLDFSTAPPREACFFVPTCRVLDNLPPAPTPIATSGQRNSRLPLRASRSPDDGDSSVQGSRADGSLGIRGLRDR